MNKYIFKLTAGKVKGIWEKLSFHYSRDIEYVRSRDLESGKVLTFWGNFVEKYVADFECKNELRFNNEKTSLQIEWSVWQLSQNRTPDNTYMVYTRAKVEKF